MKNTRLISTILWALIAVYGVATFVNTAFAVDIPVSLLILILVAFALIHGAIRYRWSGILTFVVICLVVSNILENMSILTGFPFGHYYYTNVLGPKLFLVPLLIGPAYISTGYLAWVLGTMLLGSDVRRTSSWFPVIAIPFIASFCMVIWDLCFDPTLSTVVHMWIWEQGGGYFGVPLTNYLGWFFTVFVFYFLFALFLRYRTSQAGEILPRSYYAQAILMYAIIGAAFVLAYLANHNSQAIVDAAGVVWQTGSIAEAKAIVSIFTMLFVAALSGLKLYQTAVVSASQELHATQTSVTNLTAEGVLP